MSSGLVKSIPIVRIGDCDEEETIEDEANSICHYRHQSELKSNRRLSLCRQLQSSLNNLPTLFVSNSFQNLSQSNLFSLSIANGLNQISSKISLNRRNNNTGDDCNLQCQNFLSNSRSENNLNQILMNYNQNAIEFNSTIESSGSAFPESSAQSTWSRFKNRFVPSVQTRQTYRYRFNRLLHFMRVVLTQIFSTTGLCFLVVLYTCFGAFVFTFLELPNERVLRFSMKDQRKKLAYDLWNYTLSLNVFYPDRWNYSAMERIQFFEDQVIQAVQKDGYGSTAEQWSFSGALLYSVTVVTTIGYGNVTCKTDLGRIATILYAIIGIPITFLCLANLGNLMAEAFRFSYRRVCCCFFNCCSEKTRRSRKIKKLKQTDSVRRLKRRSNPKSIEPPEHSQIQSTENEKSATILVSTVNDGKNKLKSNNQLSPELIELLNVEMEKSSALSLVSIFPNDPSQKPKVEIMQNQIDDRFSTDEEIDPDDDGKERVPIWLVFCLVVGYILLGAFMFSIWEDWGPIEGAYFCFTTLTTIGFGDLVPGSAKFSNNKDGQTKFIICCIYMMVGLSLIAMSINLVQEEIVIKSRRIGRRLGIIPDKSLKKSNSNQNVNDFYISNL